MNIRFMAQSEYFNGIHLTDDIILEKEYEQGEFTNLPKVRYYLYYLEENVRKEVMPHTDKVDIFDITNCQFNSEYLYFVEYENLLDQGYTFNVIKYNINDHTHTKIITLRDNINLYPDEKEIKIFVLDEANLIIQRALPKTSLNGEYTGFFDYTLILFNHIKNKQIIIQEENLIQGGIEFVIPYNETSCVIKTGYSLFKDNRHDLLFKEEASMESIFVMNIQQFIGDLQLEQPNLVINPIDKTYYDLTIVNAKILENYLIYSKFNYETGNEEIVFYDIDTKEVYNCINQTSSNVSLLKNATVIEHTPYMVSVNSSGTQFFNLKDNQVETVYSSDYKVRYVNNNTVISTFVEKSLFGKEVELVAIHKYPSKKIILQEKGQYIGAVASNRETTFIFLK